MIDPTRIAGNVRTVRQEMAAACLLSGRDPASVILVAVTKTQGPEVLPALRAAGIHEFGENRVEHLHDMATHSQAGDRWHFIGRVQGRQLAKVAQHAHALHSLCNLEHVERLARACVQNGRTMQVFVQVNISGEASKAGVTAEALPAILASVRSHPALELVGLMTMAPDLAGPIDEVVVRSCFQQTRTLALTHGLPGLSMGMSGDLSLAVQEGATVVRIGSRLFA